MQWWYEKLMDGEIYEGEGWGRIEATRLYDSYISEATARALHHRASKIGLGFHLKKVLPFQPGRKKRETLDFGGKRAFFYHLPELYECRKHFESLIKTEVDWHDATSLS
jgi:hypothetical protein